MSDEEIDVTNTQMVGVQGESVVVMFPKRAMTKKEALVHAAYLVVISEEHEGEFAKVLEAVQNT